MRSVLLTYEGPAALIAPILSAGAAVVGVVGARKSAKQAKAAQDQQQRALDKQADIKAKQDKLVAERTARADAATTERRSRMAQGKKGLLFEGDETGVAPTDVLGG